MPKGDKKPAQPITRKGKVVWAIMFVFIAGWMFILGILVGRGTAPVNLEMDRFEKELADLRSALREKESDPDGDESGQQNPATTQLGFYEALMQTKPAKDFKVDPKLIDQKALESLPETKPASPKPANRTAPEKETRKEPASQPRQPSKPKEPVKSPDVKKGGYTIQVAAFSDAANSRSMVSRLKEKGFPAYQIQSPSGSGGAVLHRVRVGAFQDRRSAETMLAKLQSQQFKGLVVSTP